MKLISKFPVHYISTEAGKLAFYFQGGHFYAHPLFNTRWFHTPVWATSVPTAFVGVMQWVR